MKEHRNNICSLEIICWLMANPEAKKKQFIEKFECSRRTFYRMKSYIKDRLYMYEVKEKDK